MNVQGKPLSATIIPAVLTSQGSTTVSAEVVFMMMGPIQLSEETCIGIDECALRTYTCWNDSASINLVGGFDCLCLSGPSCSGDCLHGGGLKCKGQVWTVKENRCFSIPVWTKRYSASRQLVIA